MRGAAGFQHSAMNGTGLEVLGQVFRSPLKPGSATDSAGRSHLQHNGLQPQPPRQVYLSQPIQGVAEDSSALLAFSPPTPSAR